jgi:predicted DNA-binding transcriptional regulator YafY
MTFFEQVQLLKRLDYLIRLKATGRPEELASRLGVSRASVYRYIEDLKSMDAPVAYCRLRQSFYYEEAYELKF